MTDHKKYLQRVIIHNDDTEIGEYRPLIDDKRNCQIINLANNFQDVDINTLTTISKKPQHLTFNPNPLCKPKKLRKKKINTVELRDSELKVLKSQRFEEYVIFVKQKTNLLTNEVIYLKLSKKKKKNLMRLDKFRRRFKPKNFVSTVGFGNIFEERVKNELKYWLSKYPSISAKAIYRTESIERPRMILSQQIKKKSDAENFYNNMKRFNCNLKKVVNHCESLKNVQAFIVVNRNKKILYLKLTNTVKKCLRNNNLSSKYINFDKKLFVNAHYLNIEIKNLKWSRQKNNNLYPPVLSNKSSLVTVNEYTIENMYELIQEYEENITSTQNMLNYGSVDSVMKDTYKMLVELQLNAVQQCNQLFLNYFAYKNEWSNQKVSIFTEYIKKNFKLLLKLQNRAIENSVFVNKRIKKVNNFLNKIQNETLMRCLATSQQKLGTSVSATNRKISTRNITSFSDYRLRRSTTRQEFKFQVSVSEFDTDSEVSSVGNMSRQISKITIDKKETEVQTSTIQIEQKVERCLQITKCCSPIKIPITNDRKCVQTDISVNKNTSFDFGGKKIQICKKNISLKMKTSATQENKNKSQPAIPTTEKEMRKNVNKSVDYIPEVSKQNESQKREKIHENKCVEVNLQQKTVDTEETTEKVNNLPVKNKNAEVNVPEAPKQEVTKLEDPMNGINEFYGKFGNMDKEINNLDFDKKNKINSLISPSEKEILNKLLEYKDSKTKKQMKANINRFTNSEEQKVSDFQGQNVANLEEPNITKKSESNIALDTKMQKLDEILKQIKEESKPDTDENKLSTIEENNNEFKNEILFKIQNTLESVKQRFEKNFQILRKATDMKENYIVTSNIQNLMETGGLMGDFPGKPKFIKLTPEIKATLSQSVFKTKEAIATNLNASFKLLERLNNVKQNIKTSAGSPFGALNELEESIILQRKYMPKLKLDRMQLTLTPIKNYIETNKKVISNSGRYAAKKSSIAPCINSKHIVDMNKPKTKWRRRRVSIVKNPKQPSNTNIPNIQTVRETTNVPKIFRPIQSSQIPEVPKLSDISLADVAPLHPEYPRKDNLNHVEVEKTYLYKLLNNSFSENNLEPSVQCSNINCASCTLISDDKKDKNKRESKRESRNESRNESRSESRKDSRRESRKESRRLSRRESRRESRKESKRESNNQEFFKKISVGENRSLVWEKMDWNTEITVQPDHDFDFNQFMDDPAYKNQQNVTVCPVSVSYEHPNTQKNLDQQKFEATLRNFSNAVKKTVGLNSPRTPNQGIKSITTISRNSNDPSKIQRSIQQALINNQDKFKFIQNTPQKNPRYRNISTPTPKIVSSGTFHKQKVTNVAKMAHATAIPSRKTEFLQRKPTVVAYKEDNIFDRKYKLAKVALNKESTSDTSLQDNILNSISKTVKRSQDDMHRYIQLVEQKFIKTFSLPETEKATAYTNLESEIKEMLELLHTTTEKKNAKPANTIPEVPNLKISKRSITSRPKTPMKPAQKPKICSSNQSKISNKSIKRVKQPKKLPPENNTSVIVLKEPNNVSTASEMAVDTSDKKKTADISRPTVCTDSIIFSESLAAIVSKQNVILPIPKTSSSILKNSSVPPNLKNSSSARSVNKKVRFKIDDTKITRSDSTMTMSTDYSTYFEETVSDFSSENDFTKITHPHIDVSVLLYLKLTYDIVFPVLTIETYYIIIFYQEISVKDSLDALLQPENYDVKILCKNNSYLLKKQSSFGFDDLKPILSTTSRDSLSDFIENCEEIIEATKKLDLPRRKSSPYILEFLDIISSITLENVVLKVNICFQWCVFIANLEYLPQIYYNIDYFYPIYYDNSAIDDFTRILKICHQKIEIGDDVITTGSSEYISGDENINWFVNNDVLPNISGSLADKSNQEPNISSLSSTNVNNNEYKDDLDNEIAENIQEASDSVPKVTDIFNNISFPETTNSSDEMNVMADISEENDMSNSQNCKTSDTKISNSSQSDSETEVTTVTSSSITSLVSKISTGNLLDKNQDETVESETNVGKNDQQIMAEELNKKEDYTNAEPNLKGDDKSKGNSEKTIENKDTQTTVSTDIYKKFANELGTISDELNTLITEVIPEDRNKPNMESNLKIVRFNTNKTPLLQFRNQNLHQHFSQRNFLNNFLHNYRIKFPFCQEITQSQSDTLCLDLVTYSQRKRYETIGQTLILNLQILNCSRSCYSPNNTRKSIRKKCFIPPTKNKIKLKAIEMNFDLDKVKLLAADPPHKVFLIILYIAFFSVAFLCMNLNYTCE